MEDGMIIIRSEKKEENEKCNMKRIGEISFKNFIHEKSKMSCNIGG